MPRPIPAHGRHRWTREALGCGSYSGPGTHHPPNKTDYGNAVWHPLPQSHRPVAPQHRNSNTNTSKRLEAQGKSVMLPGLTGSSLRKLLTELLAAGPRCNECGQERADFFIGTQRSGAPVGCVDVDTPRENVPAGDRKLLGELPQPLIVRAKRNVPICSLTVRQRFGYSVAELILHEGNYAVALPAPPPESEPDVRDYRWPLRDVCYGDSEYIDSGLAGTDDEPMTGVAAQLDLLRRERDVQGYDGCS